MKYWSSGTESGHERGASSFPQARVGGTFVHIFSLEGRTALITGGSRGIGYALAGALANAGARVVLNARSEDALSDAAETLSATGAAVDIEPFDVTDAEAVRDGVARIEARSPIDIVVNNAGMQRRAPLESFNDDDWHAIMSTNVDSVYYVSKSVAPFMIARGSGKIINIGSVQCDLGRAGIAPYSASKGAVKNLTKGMCADWAKYGIQANAIAPGYFDTPLNKALVEDKAFDEWLRNRTPAGRWGNLEDLHGAVVFLASSAADFVNGQIIYVDGGIVSVV